MGYMRFAAVGVLIVGLAACSGEPTGVTIPKTGAVPVADGDESVEPITALLRDD